MPFFNANPESEDLQLLPAAIRRDEELAVIAAECEAAVLAVFTILIESASAARNSPYPSLARVPSGAYALDATTGLYVCLRGYDPTPASCNALLATALRREIAAVIRWRHSQWRMNPLLASESSGQGLKAASYRDDKNLRFPAEFGAYLRPFDLRPPAVVI